MTRFGRFCLNGCVTLIILAILASLIVPAMQGSRRSMHSNCMSKARAIAGSIRAYASNWDGWTNPDPEYYVKLSGYKLNSEIGYFGEDPGWCVRGSNRPSQSQIYASKLKDFVCPDDKDPFITRHGVPTSYRVMPLFAGSNVMDLTGEANRTLVLREIRRRHPVGGR